jgi:hypothetical protein
MGKVVGGIGLDEWGVGMEEEGRGNVWGKGQSGWKDAQRKGELVCRREAASRGGVRALYGIKQAEVESLSRFGRTGHVSEQAFHRLFACVLVFNVPFSSFVST